MYVALLALALHTTAALPRARSVSHSPSTRSAVAGVKTYRGTFSDGATYAIEVPANWNGTLMLYSHGYVIPGQPNPAQTSSNTLTGQYLLTNGYALGASSYASAGWAVAEALPDQIAVLDTFGKLVGTPQRTIAWGESMGGLITAGLMQQYPTRFSAALPLCGALAGSVGMWNGQLDTAFAFNTLVANGALQVVNISNPAANYNQAITLLESAQTSASGQARIALAAALDDVAGWFRPRSPQPASTNYAGQEANQFAWLEHFDFLFGFDLRAELETRAGGNPSWNAGIDYRAQLANSAYAAEVKALYAKAGLNLDADLSTLNAAAGIAANPAALTYLSDNIIFDGNIAAPVLTLQTEGDGLVVNESDTAYAAAVGGAGNAALLRETFVARAGHCSFTPGETIAALGALVERLNSGGWTGLDPATLNAAAQALGSQYNPYPPAFATFVPGPFLRPDNGVPPQPSVLHNVGAKPSSKR